MTISGLIYRKLRKQTEQSNEKHKPHKRFSNQATECKRKSKFLKGGMEGSIRHGNRLLR